MVTYKFSPNGYPLNVNSSGSLYVTTSPVGGYFPYKYGPNGSAIHVDGLGRLVVCLDENELSPSGVLTEVIDDFSDTLDGIKKEFLLSKEPQINTLKIFRNGVLCKQGETNDYVLTGSGTFVTNFVQRSMGSLIAVYFHKE